MPFDEILARIQGMLTGILGAPAEKIRPDARLLKDLGADSWQYLEFRTEIERVFGVVVPDTAVNRLGTPKQAAGLVAELLDAGRPAARVAEAAPAPAHADRGADARLLADGRYAVDLEVGLPLMGRNNLGETPLLKVLGAMRWDHMRRLTGVPSRRLTDESGERLLPTFYYVKIRFPRERPLAFYGENDRITVVNTLQSYGGAILDGFSFLYPADWAAERKTAFLTGEQAEAAGVPYVRTSNIFVKRVEGAGKLRNARPVQKEMANLPQAADVPSTYALLRKATEEGRFVAPPPHSTRLTPERGTVRYEIDPDRDLNALGLLYFANYPAILDTAERSVLSKAPVLPIPADLLDARTVVYREIAYLANAHASDPIDVHVDAWIENPFLGDHPTPTLAPVRLLLNYEMRRLSDGEKMLVSTAEKVVTGRTLLDSGLLDRLRDLAR
ncbi:MAG TPA: LnmK family bifunctional acyltransferase/decarboxylase [Planctomycetota bacterium]|nr:LnmK family bifunctional acyltransferase/decarboxylase [Planctomycetota bacterium]